MPVPVALGTLESLTFPSTMAMPSQDMGRGNGEEAVVVNCEPLYLFYRPFSDKSLADHLLAHLLSIRFFPSGSTTKVHSCSHFLGPWQNRSLFSSIVPDDGPSITPILNDAAPSPYSS